MPLKGQQREMVFSTIQSYSGSRVRIPFFLFWSNFGCIQRIWRVHQDFQQLMRTPQGQYFNHGRRDIISETQENKMRLKFFACPTGKYHSAYSPYELNELNIEYWNNTKKFKILSFYPGKDAMSEETISRYCPFKIHFRNIPRNENQH